MKKKNIFSAILTMCLVLTGATSFTACSNDDLDTNQFVSGVGLNVYGPTPVMRGGTLRFIGSNLDQISQVEIPGVAPITNIEVVKAGIPSEIRVVVPHDGPVPGIVKLTTKTGNVISTITELNYTEGLDPANITMPASAMPGEKIQITIPEGSDDYLDIIQMVEFADGVRVGVDNFTAHNRYVIEVVVPEEAKTGKLNLYTVDLTNIEVDPNNVEYQIISTQNAIEIGVPSTSKIASPRGEADVLGTITAKVGETITLTGNYYNLVEKVVFGNVEVTDFEATKTSVTFALPAEAPDGAFNFITRSGVEVPVGNINTVKPSEAVATPNPVKAGAVLVINGKDLDVVTSVEFPDADAQSGDAITVAADKIIVKAVPEKATEGNITLRMANGAGVELAYTLVKPVVTGYGNSVVNAGGALVIKGTNLDLVKSVQFGDGTTDLKVEPAADGNSITLTVPMDAVSGKPTLKLANGTTVSGPDLTVNEAVFCYATALPGAEEEIKAGGTMNITVVNSDKLTSVEIDGNACQWILTGDEKNQVIIGIPETAGTSSVLRLVSSNGEISYKVSIIPATSVNKTVWSGLTQISWSDGGRVLIPASAFDGVPAGAVLTLCYSQVDGQWDQAQINYGDWSTINFSEGDIKVNGTLVPTDIYGWFSDGVLYRETPLVLTQEILDNIQAKMGEAEGKTGMGIIIQGSGLTFSKVTISYTISLEIDLASKVANMDGSAISYPYKFTWDDTGRFNLSQDLLLNEIGVKKGSKFIVYKSASEKGQIQINNSSWTSITSLTDWDPKLEVMELEFDDAIMEAVNNGGLVLQGDLAGITKIAILP